MYYTDAIHLDEMIERFKSMTTTSGEAHAALASQLQTLKNDLRHQEEFAAAIQRFQEQILRDLDDTQDKAIFYLTKMVKSIEIVFQDVLNRFSKGISNIETNVAGLSKVFTIVSCDYLGSIVQDLERTREEAGHVHDGVGRVFQQVLKGSSELAATQTIQLAHSQELAEQLQISLNDMRNEDVQNILGAFGSIQQHLVNFHTCPHAFSMPLMMLANLERACVSYAFSAE